MNGFSRLHQISPALKMNIQGYGHDLSSSGWKVERMMIDEATHESETGLPSPLKTLFDYWRKKNWGHGHFDPVTDLDIRVQCVVAKTRFSISISTISERRSAISQANV
jgi:hypothetical protein